METIYDREQFIIGDVVIEVWEGQTGWKWRITNIAGENEDMYPSSGYGCESQLTGLLMALSWLSKLTLEGMVDFEYYDITALYPGLKMHGIIRHD